MVNPLSYKLARIGTSGRYPSNVERDLMRVLNLPVPIFWVMIPVRSLTDRYSLELKSVPVLLPHLLYDYLHEAHLIKYVVLFRPSRF